MKRLFFALLLNVLVSAPALACACCGEPNTLVETQAQKLPGAKLSGEMGLLPYGGPVDSTLDAGTGQLTGQLQPGTTQLELRRDGKLLGHLSWKPAGTIQHRLLGLDFVLAPEQLQQLKLNPEARVFHEFRLPVTLTADTALVKALGVSFVPRATLLLHGIGNACWDGGTSAGRWTLLYQVQHGHQAESWMARGISTPL